RHTPRALARDAPVRPVLDHSGDALLAPLRRPLHLPDVAQSMLTQRAAIHADEPLRRGPEDDRRLVAPAMRVAVHEGLVMHQPAALPQRIEEHAVRLIDAQSRYERGVGEEAAVVGHRVDDGQPVALPDGEVLVTV